MAAPLIEIKSVTKTYKIGSVSYNALNNVSLVINEGEFLAIMGPSGSGKSTLLNLTAGMDRPSSGEILVEGKNLALLKDNQLAKYRQTSVGMVFQNFNLLPQYTALENTNLALVIQGFDNKEGKAKAVESLKWVGLEARVNNRPTELSGGEQQRVAIVRALLKNPKIVLADEPTGNLDTKTGEQIIELLKSLKTQGKTVIIVTHNQEIAQKADRIIQMRDGQIIGV